MWYLVRSMMQVWFIVFTMIPFVDQVEAIGAEYEEIGCFCDNYCGRAISRAISGKVTTYSYETSVRRCYERAKEDCYTHFAVQTGMCFTSPDAGETYDRFGEDYGCKNGRGGYWKNTVYKITEDGMLGCGEDSSTMVIVVAVMASLLFIGVTVVLVIIRKMVNLRRRRNRMESNVNDENDEASGLRRPPQNSCGVPTSLEPASFSPRSATTRNSPSAPPLPSGFAPSSYEPCTNLEFGAHYSPDDTTLTNISNGPPSYHALFPQAKCQ